MVVEILDIMPSLCRDKSYIFLHKQLLIYFLVLKNLIFLVLIPIQLIIDCHLRRTILRINLCHLNRVVSLLSPSRMFYAMLMVLLHILCLHIELLVRENLLIRENHCVISIRRIILSSRLGVLAIRVHLRHHHMTVLEVTYWDLLVLRGRQVRRRRTESLVLRSFLLRDKSTK